MIKASPATETMAAVLTADAPGAIAVIGVSGPDVPRVISRVLRRREADEPPSLPLRAPVLCRVVNGDAILDDVIAVYIQPEPFPYVEICTHGGIAVVQAVTAALAHAGVRIVEADQLPQPLNSADPIQREVDAALVHVGSRRMAYWLLGQRQILPQAVRDAKTWSADERDAFLARSRAAARLLRGITIAIVGPPNAGKSTLANRLIGSDRIITSHEPGTTRDWVSETAMIKGWPVMLTDTAGVRSTECGIEREAIRRGISQARDSDLALIVLAEDQIEDARRKSIGHFESLLPVDLPRIMVLNKADLNPEMTMVPHSFLSISALHGQGIEKLESAIEERLGLDQLKPDLPAALTEGQRCALQQRLPNNSVA